GGGGGGVGAVAVGVAGGLVDLGAGVDRVIGRHEPLAGDQLVVALEHVRGRGQRVVAEVAGPLVAVGPRRRCRHAAVGEGGVLGPGAGVDHPTITPSPPLAAPPSYWYRTGAPMNWGLEPVGRLGGVSFWRAAPPVRPSRSATLLPASFGAPPP